MNNTTTSISVMLIVLCLIVLSKSDGLKKQLCSNKKSGNTCVCRRTTSDGTNLPITIGDCTRIGLEAFADRSQLNDDLNSLDFSFNRIIALSKTEQQFTSTNLLSLKLSYNSISYIDAGFFDGFPNLIALDLSHNNITKFDKSDFFINLNKLVQLNLSFNRLTILPDQLLLPLNNLKVLDLSYNDIGDWLMQSPNSLINSLSLSTETLTHLSLNNVGLKDTYNFDGFQNLKYLSIADNAFLNVPSLPYSVEFLDLSANYLTTLQAEYLNYHSLKILKLSRSKKLQYIHKYAFYNLLAIEEISITDCPKLSQISELAFGLMSKGTVLPLRKLNLARNYLETLNYTYKYLLEHLEMIDLSNNPWKCDCDLIWLQEYGYFLRNNASVR